MYIKAYDGMNKISKFKNIFENKLNIHLIKKYFFIN